MRTLLVSDLHYDLRKLDWVLAEAAGVDLLVVAGDLLDISSSVPLDAQVAVVLEYLGPATLARLEAGLDAAAAHRTLPWIWAYHGPPEGPLSWTGERHYGDPELPRLIDQHRPDVVLCGHIHQAPYVEGGGWWERRGTTHLFNSGYQRGELPAHVILELSPQERTATWWSLAGSGEMTLVDQ